MSVELIYYNFADRFNELIESTEIEIRIMSPFIGYKTACKLADLLNNKKKVNCKIITRFYREDFIQ